MKNSLEKSKLFPFLAWAAILGFAYVTYTFTNDLQTEVEQVAALSGYMQ